MPTSDARLDPLARRRLRIERWLTLSLVAATLDTVYLSWRFVALYAGWVEPGTGLCSLTATIDCDPVLRSPEARAFYVPNAILGLGFFSGCLSWWLVGLRLGVAYRAHVVRTLAFWLAFASLVTLWFWRLLLGLPTLCPLCPWNHLLTYLAAGLAWAAWRLSAPPRVPARRLPLLLLVAGCVAWFWLWQAAWIVAETSGLLAPPG